MTTHRLFNTDSNFREFGPLIVEHYITQLSFEAISARLFFLRPKLDDILKTIQPGCVSFINNDYYVIAEHVSYMVFIDKNKCQLIIAGKTFKIIDDVLQTIQQYFIYGNLEDKAIHYLYKYDNYLENTTISVEELDKDRFNVNKKLYNNVDIDILLHSFAKAYEAVMILHGKPGTGKTSFIKYCILNGPFNKIAFIKDQETMSYSKLWASLSVEGYDLIIFDDLMIELTSRQDQSNKFMGDLLSFSDGIFTNKSKIIISTNLNMNDIDDALTRRGRCFDLISLEPLSRDEAVNLWVNEFNMELSTLKLDGEEITQAELMHQYRLITNNNQKNYMLKGGKSSVVGVRKERLGF